MKGLAGAPWRRPRLCIVVPGSAAGNGARPRFDECGHNNSACNSEYAISSIGCLPSHAGPLS